MDAAHPVDHENDLGSISVDILRCLVAFRQAYPGIALRVGISNTAQAAKAVSDGTAELGFIEGAIDEPALSCEQFGEDRLVIVVGPTHPWARRDRIEVGELTQSDWVLREVGSGTRSTFETSIEQLGLASRHLKVVLDLPSNEAILDTVEAGGGATVISELVAVAALQSGALRRIPIDLPARPFFVVGGEVSCGLEHGFSLWL
jgi:DNA-binding transcriptional LysR family regulator